MRRLLSIDRERDRVVVPVAIVLALAVVVADVITRDRAVLIGLLIVAPLVCGASASPRATRAVAAGAIALAVASPLWNDSFPTWWYWVSLAVVTVGSLFAAVMADFRAGTRTSTRRMQILADLAALGQEQRDRTALAQAITERLVPRYVDLCVIDVLDEDGNVERVAGAYRGDRALLDAFLRRPPSPASVPSAARAAASPGETVHMPAVDDALRRRLAHDDDDLRLIEALALESVIIVPLVTRSHTVGVLTLATRAPRPRLAARDEVEFAETLAGRVGLAIDNATLAEELSAAERQLDAILANVDAAIMARDVKGRLVYTNQAAADLLKLPDPEAVRNESSESLMNRFDVYTEEGGPVSLAELPGTLVLQGDPAPDPIVVRNVVKATGEERWLLNKATPVRGSDGRILMAVNLIEDVTETKRSEIAQRLLVETARSVAEAPDAAAALQAVADAAVPGLADWAGVDVVEGGGTIRAVAIAHQDPEKVQLGWRLRDRWPVDPDEDQGIAAVVRTGESQLVPEVSDEMLVAGARDEEHLSVLRSVGLTSTMIVPVTAGRRVLGALSFVSSTSRRFDERDLQLATSLGSQIGAYINNAQLSAEQARIAHTLQAGLLPQAIPAIDGWEVATAYRAAGRANEVGGDFYDVVPYDGGWAAIVGDVVGKGPEAASITALARHTLASIIELTGDPGVALSALNRRLRQTRPDFSGMCTIAIVAVSGDQATVYSAGHPLPVRLRDGEARLVGTTDRLLGVFDEVDTATTTVELEPGDQIVLYTDGVLDAVGAMDRFGEQRLLDALRDIQVGAGGDVASALVDVVDGFLARDQGDDIAVVSLTRIGVAAEAAPA